MSDIVIKIENLSKKYVIGAKDNRFCMSGSPIVLSLFFQGTENSKKQNFGHCAILTSKSNKVMS